MYLRADQERALLQRKAVAKVQIALREEREHQSNTHGGLIHFVRYFWHVLEPKTELKEDWPLYAICDHLEAVTRGEIRRLLMNVPPGFMKSLLTNVFWPAWEWSAAGKPDRRYVTFSYSSSLTERDNGRFALLLRSHDFQEMWGHAFELTKVGEVKVANNKTGWKLASSVGGVGTGERGDVVLVDDGHNVKTGESEAVRTETVRWFRESLSDRFNNMETGALICIMQRLHEDDIAGVIISNEKMNYCHLMIPMEHDVTRHCRTQIGWEDPRTSDYELAWPNRFPAAVIEQLKAEKGPYAYAAQYQQEPQPRGGGIIQRSWWQIYKLDKKGKPVWPPHTLIGSLDPAYSNKEENDPSGFSVWGVFKDEDGFTKIALVYAWEKRLNLHGVTVERKAGESNESYISRSKPEWGLTEWVAHDCTRLQVDVLLIESGPAGESITQEIRRLHRTHKWGVQTVKPILDKRERAYGVQHLFADKMIFAPDRDWAETVIGQFTKFRGLPGDRDHLVDTGTQALRYLRDNGMAVRREEKLEDERDRARYQRPLEPLYDV